MAEPSQRCTGCDGSGCDASDPWDRCSRCSGAGEPVELSTAHRRRGLAIVFTFVLFAVAAADQLARLLDR